MEEKLDYRIEKASVAASFGRAAATYDRHASLQREVADQLAASLGELTGAGRVLDLGSGTGYCAPLLRRACPNVELFSLDISRAMLRHARAKQTGGALVCADAEAPPFADASFDLVFSSLTIQWCRDHPRLFAGLRRILAPGGRCLISTFGPATLGELRRAWSTVDTHIHVNRFAAEAELREAAAGAGLRCRSLTAESLVRHYPGLAELGDELKGIGARNMNAGQSRGLTGKRRLARLREAFQQGEAPGRGVPVTWEVLYLDLEVP